MPRSCTPCTILSLASLISLAAASPLSLFKRGPVWEGGYYNPTSNGGQWLTLARDTYPPGLGEPINLVISSESDSLLMTDSGFFDFCESIYFSGECLGQTGGLRQAANLGDGKGMINQTTLLRENFGDPSLGTCLETVNGGFHFRVWRQNGSEADSGAWFLAASQEQNLTLQHGIVPNGYDLGRDQVVQRAIASGGTKSPLTNRTFTTSVANASGPGYYAHITTSQINHGIGTDGIVAVLTVKVTSNGSVKATSGAVPALSLSRRELARILCAALASCLALSLLA
ncbi:secreted protein [Rhodotorula toruloides]|uniref:Secreted protein n=1 Tax=Rhodotorula toruloides TaxID=5286 RepID=A0A511KHD4_RHOTO|nr:secreted protein [Rhodotorula toruloides]